MKKILIVSEVIFTIRVTKKPVTTGLEFPETAVKQPLKDGLSAQTDF